MPGLHALQNKLSKKGFTILGVTKPFDYGSVPAATGEMKDKLSKTKPDPALQAVKDEFDPKFKAARKAEADAKTDDEKKTAQDQLKVLQQKHAEKLADPFKAHITKFHELVKTSYPFVVATDSEIDAYKVPGYPTLFIVDKQGRVVYVQVGGGRDKILEAVIEKQLAAK